MPSDGIPGANDSTADAGAEGCSAPDDMLVQPCSAYTADSLVTRALFLCNSGDFDNANSMVNEAIDLISIAEMTNQDSPGNTDSLNIIGRITDLYTQHFPQAYLDSIPAEVAAQVFKAQMVSALDTMEYSSADSLFLAEHNCDGGIPFNVPIVINRKVQSTLYYLAVRRSGGMQNLLNRASYWLPTFQKMFNDAGLPTDLAYLPLLESAFNLKAYSYAHASGLWQFIPATGRLYNLRMDAWVDERRDPIKATQAAIGYLSKLYGDFGNWHLALAAYNCGENGLARAITRAGTDNYWELPIPKQTQDYVPIFIAYQRVAKNPACFGFRFPTDSMQFDLDTVHVSEGYDIDKIAAGIDISSTIIRDLNPHILTWCTSPFMPDVTLYLPRGSAEKFRSFYSTLTEDDRIRWSTCITRKGDTMARVAKRNHVSLASLKALNRVNPNKKLVAGTTLFIPISAPGTASAGSSTVDPPFRTAATGLRGPAGINENELSAQDASRIASRDNTLSTRETIVRPKTVHFVLRKGQTLDQVADDFNVSVKDICLWNKIKNASKVPAGKMLEIRTVVTIARDKTPISAERQEAAATSMSHYRTVRSGETLYGIALALDVSQLSLARWNGINPRKPIIHAGDKLVYYSKSSPRTAAGEKPAPRSAEASVERAQKNNPGHAGRYVVSDGDNLFQIAKRNGTTVKALIDANDLDASGGIAAGDRLIIPAQSPSRTNAQPGSKVVYYTVRQGDNLFEIAERFRIPLDSIYEANDLSEKSVIKPGTRIKIVLAGN